MRKPLAAPGIIRRHAAAGIRAVAAAARPPAPCPACLGRGSYLGAGGASVLCGCQSLTAHMELVWLPSLPEYAPESYVCIDGGEDDD